MCNDHDHTIVYIAAYKRGKKTEYRRLCFQHAVKAALQGVDIDAEVSTEREFEGCSICKYL